MLPEAGDSTTAIILALIATVGTLLGGFAILGNIALKMFLGKDRDGKGGAWGSLTDAVASLKETVDELVKGQNRLLDMLGKGSDDDENRAAG